MTWRLYRCDPIDDWTGWHTPVAITALSDKPSIDAKGQETVGLDGNGVSSSRWAQDFEIVQRLASNHGWQGDFQAGPYVSMLPQQEGHYGWPPYLIAWKQHDNGTTFIASTLPLPWLTSCEVDPDENRWDDDDLSSDDVPQPERDEPGGFIPENGGGEDVRRRKASAPE